MKDILLASQLTCDMVAQLLTDPRIGEVDEVLYMFIEQHLERCAHCTPKCHDMRRVIVSVGNKTVTGGDLLQLLLHCEVCSLCSKKLREVSRSTGQAMEYVLLPLEWASPYDPRWGVSQPKIH